MAALNLFGTNKDYSLWNPSSPEEAWCCLLYAIAMNDGVITDVEFDTWANALIATQQFKGLDVVPMVQEIKSAAAHRSWNHLALLCAGYIRQDVAPTVFAMACEVVMRDGAITDGEKRLLSELSTALSLSEEEARVIVDVSVIRWRHQVRFV